jgi:hypothetical protein
MASKHILELIETYIDAHASKRTFLTNNEYLAWRSGLLAGLIASIAQQDSLIYSVLHQQVKKLLK